MRFGVLGELAVWTDEGDPVDVPGAKVRALLAVLLVHRGEPVSADRLREELWEEPPPDPAAALQTAVSRLRRALERGEAGYRDRVGSGPSGYRLGAGADQVDAGRFEALVGRARGAAPAEAVRLLDGALALWRGPALADHADAPFAREAVARWEELRLWAVEERARARLELGEDSSLVAELEGYVRRHPSRERLRAAHMLALYRSGRQGEALESYQGLRELLAEELGVDPGPEVSRLHGDILRQAPVLALPGGGAPMAVPDGPSGTSGDASGTAQTAEGPSPVAHRTGNVPAPLTDVVGREACVPRVRSDLARSRLVTLLGPGGVGKTTLALASVTAADPEFGEVWFVELAGRDTASADTDSVAGEVAAALGIHDEAPSSGRADKRPASARIAESLGSGPVLLVLDNCEHVVAPVSALVVRLLRASPGLRVLATSREPLGVPGEQLHQVRPLGVPRDSSPESLAASDAVELFTRRAAASGVAFTVDEGNADAVAAVCRGLDGLPLALELAAARVRSLGVRELAVRLDDRFRVLGSSGAGVHTRQRTLHAMVDWSWQLLSGPERTVLRRLSVQAGPFSLETAEATATDPGPGRGDVVPGDVAGMLAALVDRSLVVVEQDRCGTRYRMLETIRAFAREELAKAGEEEAFLLRHAEHVANGLARSEPRHLVDGESSCLEWLDQGSADIRAAAEWAADRGRAGLAMRITGSLGWYWYLRGRHREGHRLLTRALAAEGDASDADRATALLWHAALGFAECAEPGAEVSARPAIECAERLPDPRFLARARAVLVFMSSASDTAGEALAQPDELLERSLRVFEELDEPWWSAFTLHLRGWRALHRSDLRAARRDARRGLDLFAPLREPWGLARVHSLLGVLAGVEGSYAESARLHRTSLEYAERIGLWPTVVDELSRLARVSMLTGDLDASDEYNRRALRVAREQAFSVSGRFARAGLGMAARRRGDPAGAEEHLREVLRVHRIDGYRPGLAFALAELGFCAEQQGDAGTARDLHLEGLGYARRSGDPRAVAQALEGVAGAEALEGGGERAALLLGAAARAREDAGAPLPDGERFDVDRVRAAARALAGGAAFDREWARGRSLPLDGAVDLVLSPVAHR